MATTTPNFGWVVPTSTDLVKNGATAIETLGDSIDASMVDLKGGTTGQVLSKTSNTDMDFTWVAQDDSNAIQNAIVDAKGDLIAASAADTPARLAVGTNGQILSADSTAATGLAWITNSAGGMTLLDTKTLNNTVTNYTFTSIAGTYKKLVIVGVGLQSASTGNDYFKIQFNSDTGSNYIYGIHSKQNTTFYGEGNNTTNSIRSGFHFAQNADSTRYRGIVVMEIPEYAGGDYKQIVGNWGSGSGGVTWTGMFSGGWNSTDAITSIKLESGDAVNLKAGTIKLYGVS